MDEPLRLDVWSDIACPWCWIGHARLRRALAEEEPGSVEVVHRAFELAPHLPPAGIPAEEHHAKVLGPAEAVRAAHERLTAEGAAEGVEFRFDLQARAPNTRLAHRLVKLATHAGDPGAGAAALDALFSAHFTEGLDVADPDVVVPVVARAARFKPDALRAAAEEGAGEQEVAADQALAERAGVHGVPFFLAGGRVAVSGAHEPALLRKLLAAARERRTAA